MTLTIAPVASAGTPALPATGTVSTRLAPSAPPPRVSTRRTGFTGVMRAPVAGGEAGSEPRGGAGVPMAVPGLQRLGGTASSWAFTNVASAWAPVEVRCKPSEPNHG